MEEDIVILLGKRHFRTDSLRNQKTAFEKHKENQPTVKERYSNHAEAEKDEGVKTQWEKRTKALEDEIRSISNEISQIDSALLKLVPNVGKPIRYTLRIENKVYDVDVTNDGAKIEVSYP